MKIITNLKNWWNNKSIIESKLALGYYAQTLDLWLSYQKNSEYDHDQEIETYFTEMLNDYRKLMLPEDEAKIEEIVISAKIKHHPDYDWVLDALKTDAIKRGIFTLSNGKTSDCYFDVKSVLCDGIDLCRITQLIHDTAIDHEIVYDRVAGMELGSVPLVVSLCQSYDATYDFVIVRKPKDHGIVKKYEGKLNAGARILVLEDVITSGKSVLEICKIIEEAGAIVSGIISVIDREDEKLEEFKKYKDRYIPLFRKSELI